MILVVFKYKLKEEAKDDIIYQELSKELNALSIDGLISCTDYSNDSETITLYYWETKEALMAWVRHLAHIKAKKYGKENVYETFSTEISEIIRKY